MEATSRITFLGHATVALELAGMRVLTDPLLTPRLGLLFRHVAHIAQLAEAARADVVLISHGHQDHLHLPSLALVPGHPQMVVPVGLGSLLAAHGHHATEISAGQTLTFGALRVRATAARHVVRRALFGPITPALGYVISADGSPRIYFAGDTDLFPEMADLAGSVDVALIPVWGWGPRLGPGHLDPARGAEAVRLIRPRLAIPIHWGTFYPFELEHFWPKPLADPPVDFAREVARIAPDTTVRILAPGEAMDLPVF